jgi:penicillin-binding protein 2
VLRGTFPPGSTYKPYLATGALTDGIRTAQWSFHDPGFFMFAGHRFRDDVPGGHGIVDMHKAIQVSCDVYFYMVAHDWGVDGMAKWTQQFGFGQATGIDLKGEAKGVLPSREWKRKAFRSPAQQRWYPGDTISLGIGQGYNSFTPLQMATALSTLANQGTRYEPRVVRAIEDMGTRRFTPVVAPVAQRVDLNPAYWQVVHGGMMAVNQTGGTGAEAFKGALYTSAGKTGTAQVFSVGQNQTYDAKDIAHHLRDHALYVVYAPADNPVIALAMIVENAGFGGVAAAPIARKALDYHLLGLYPTDEEIEKISGAKPQPVQFAYAGEREGVPIIPGAKPPPVPATSAPAGAASGAASGAAAAMGAAGVAAKPAPAPAAASSARAQPTAFDAEAVGNYPRTACTGGLRAPLFTRFGARPDVSDESEGVRL